jgi:hypothetical protein
LVEAAGAGAGASCGFEECLFGHDGDGSLRLAPGAGLVGIPRRGASGLAARGALVKKLFRWDRKIRSKEDFPSEDCEEIDSSACGRRGRPRQRLTATWRVFPLVK